MKSLLLAALLLLQDGDLDGLVRQLGAADPALRDRASAAIAARGVEAREALLQGRSSSDPEIRNRAGTLLLRIDHALHLQALEKADRPRKLKLLADQPHEDFPGRTAVTDGAVFIFTRRPWAPKGTVLGTIFASSVDARLQGEIDWSVAAVRGDKDLAFETCSFHSPALVYVPGEAPDSAVLALKGLRRWYCDVPVELKDPVEGMTTRVGPYALTVRWPDILVHVEGGVADEVLAKVLTPKDIRCTMKADAPPFAAGGRNNSVFAACGRRAIPKTPAWCGCDAKPAADPLEPKATVQDMTVIIQTNPQQRLEHIASISLAFHKPVEESFELSSPPLK